jgi:magnesium transporter
MPLMPKNPVKERSAKAGLPPGTPVHIGEQSEKTRIVVMDYNQGGFKELEAKAAEECLPFKKDKKTVTWVSIYGLQDVKLLEEISKQIGLHPLVVEDIVDTQQRPKMEDYDDYLYIVLKMLTYDEKHKKVETEQMSLVLGPNFVVSFQEREGGIFDRTRGRIRNNKGKIRKMGADFLAYTLLDAIVDNYFLILEKLGERIEILEVSLIKEPSPKTIQAIHKLKREMIVLRKSVWPLREVVNGLERESRSKSPLIKKETSIYLRDVYDHTIQVIDNIETSRDIVSGMVDIYLSSISNKLNEVMKVLTIIGTIFIPLTFITGIYGMNFRYMPEIDHPFGYFTVLGVMLISAILMLIYFRKKKWL